MGIHTERLEEAVKLAKLGQRHAEDLGRNFLRDWVRESVREITASDASFHAAAACAILPYDKVELLCEALGKDLTGVVGAANNELRSVGASNQLKVVADDSSPRPIIRFTVRTATATRS
jgi:hypothetical protein